MSNENNLQQELEKLREENAYLKNTLKNLLEGLSNDSQLHLPWIGNLGHWYWYVPENEVEFNEAKIEAIGYKRANIKGKVDYQFFMDKVHPDDYDYVMNNMYQHMIGNTEAYEVSYRIKHIDGYYKWYYDRGTVTTRNDKGEPLMIAGIVFDISEQKEKEEKLITLNKKLEHFSTIDELTDVYNRRRIQERLEEELIRNRRYNHNISVIFIDLDNFKGINDTHGHNTGDKILKIAATIIKENVRAVDIIGRWGGDEFIVISPETDVQSATRVAKRILQRFNERAILNDIKISASIGVSACMANDNVYLAVNRVDRLMYCAKTKGGNLVVNDLD